MKVEVAYALKDEQTLLTVELPEGSTAKQAIEQSDIMIKHPEINLSKNKIGIFGKIIPLDWQLNPHDRVEIYRPLLVDPKKARLRRAEKKLR